MSIIYEFNKDQLSLANSVKFNETIVAKLNENITEQFNQTIAEKSNETIVENLNETIVGTFNETNANLILNNVTKMGLFGSKTVKTVDSTGHVNNTFVIEGNLPVASTEVIILLAVLVALRIIELCYRIYNQHTKRLKRKYTQKSKSGSTEQI